ncbi:Serine beta-lactamase-like protein LACTB, mitochondrial [Halotydeus destructor]|nr:Serine beta-lactamase-like protein LACTB, mitochondrial [Halotydeus destructor]
MSRLKNSLKVCSLAAIGSGLLYFRSRNEVKADSSCIKCQQVPLTKVVNKARIRKAINKCAIECERQRMSTNIPGLVIGVSIGGKQVWLDGFGFANIEQGVKCNGDTVMRIASISKPITMILAAKLIEAEKLDLDKTVRHYLTEEEFPTKYWKGKPVDITLRQLVSHLGGIRHYKTPDNQEGVNSIDYDSVEFYSRKQFSGVIESLNMFKHDELVAEPGSKFVYTTFGWGLVSAIIEKALPTGSKFESYLIDELRTKLGMHSTYLDQNDPLISNRANYYITMPKTMTIINAPAVDNSYKWAGGGLLSTIPDLLKFGNVTMYSYLGSNEPNSTSYLTQSTISNILWKAVEATREEETQSAYGAGWILRSRPPMPAGATDSLSSSTMVAYHSGGAVGASSFLLVIPDKQLVVAAFCNLQSVSLSDLCFKVAEAFDFSDKSP